MSVTPTILVQKLRLQHGWSQEQLAELSGLSVRTIQRIERGQSASVESLKALGAVFDIKFSAFRETEMISPSQTVTNEEMLALAQVRRVKGFYVHLFQYCATSCALLVLNFYWHPRYMWALPVVIGWGSGVAIHGLKVFGKIPFLNADWERRQAEKYLGRKL